MKDPERELLFGLIKLLDESGEPFVMAARLMIELLGDAEEVCHEMGEVLGDMERLARLEKQALPAADLSAVRRDLEEMGRLRQRLELDRLFTAETRESCGRHAVPLLALTLFQVWSRVEVFGDWLESADLFRLRVDALLHHRRSGDRPSPS